MSEIAAGALIIDRDEAVWAELAEALGGAGCTTVFAGNRDVVFTELRHQTFDLIVLNLIDPDLNGEQILRALKVAPAARSIPVIGLFDEEQMDDLAYFMKMGLVDFVTRPLNAGRVKARLLAVLHGAEQRDADAARLEHFKILNQIGIALSAERNHERLLENILLDAKDITHADGGSLYLRTEDDKLKFAIMRTESLNFALGGTTGKDIPFPPLPMHNPETGEPNHRNIATHAALTGRSINIPDAYEAEGFDFSGTRAFDERTGYRSQSFLTIPMKNHIGEVIGVLQLLNARDSRTDQVIAFSPDIQSIVESLASQAAVAVDNQILLEAQKDLLDSFIKLIASAIDAKSPYTGGHCARVPVLTEMIADAACATTDGPFADFDLDDDGRYELHTAGWLHDCGKVTTPEYVVDKGTKLETIFDRIHLIRTRFEVLKRDAEIAYLKDLAAPGADAKALKAAFDARIAALDDDMAFIETANVGGEFMSDDKIERIQQIAAQRWIGPDGAEADVLDDNETYNLSIRKGTLTEEERTIINHHIVMTIDMLEKLPFPKHLRNVPEYAGGHHERMDGRGYPRGLTGDQMSLPARMMAIADVFEALTAADRPYKKAMKLSQAMDILGKMKLEHHIDPELFDLFVEHKVYMSYAEQFLQPEQIDEIDVDKYLGPLPETERVKKSA